MVIRKAKVTEAKKIKKIIDIFVKQGLMLPRSLDNIFSNIRDFTVTIIDNQIIGVGALSIFTENFAEIRSIGVLDKYRNNGVGNILVKSCIAEAKECNISNVFTLTYIPDYFKKLGFKTIPKERLPHKIWRDCISCEHFYNCTEEALIYKLNY